MEKFTGLQELNATIEELFSPLDKNIADAANRMKELNAAIAGRGTDSLEAIQANSKDMLELEQVKAFHDSLLTKRKNVLEEQSPAVYQRMKKIAADYFQEKDQERLTKETAAIREHWNAIQVLDEKMTNDRVEESSKVTAALQAFVPYLNEQQKNSPDIAYGFGLYRGAGSTYKEMIQGGRFN